MAPWIGPGGRLLAAGALAGLAAAAGAAISVEQQAREAERAHPPRHRFMTSGGVRLHYLDTEGPGQAVVMLHGNGAMMADLEISGIAGRVAGNHRTLLFDRPGHGYSERPPEQAWGPFEQARLLRRALRARGVERPVVLGHSWGALVALAMAIDDPGLVGGLVLAAGYYFPEERKDIAALAVPATPVLGGVLRHTLAPFLLRRLAPRAIARIFAPSPVPERFREDFPLALALRPSQIRASTEELAMINAAAAELAPRYGEIRVPVAIVAGEADRIVDTERHAVRLHRMIPGSTLHVMPGAGHMLHYTEADALAAIIDAVAALSLAAREGA